MRLSTPALALALIAPVVAASQPVPFGPEFRVNTYTTGLQSYGVASVAPDGTFIVVWGGDFAADPGVFGQRYDASGIPAGPPFQINVDTQFASHPDIALDGQGAFIVVWSVWDPNGGDVFARRFDASGAPQGPDFRVNTYTTGLQAEPSAASDDMGRVVVVWDDEGHATGQSGVYAQRYDAGGQPHGGEFEVDSITGDWPHHPTVASDPAGGFVVAWNRVSDVYARRYDGSGMPAGTSFRVNGDTSGGHQDPFVASDPNGNFTVVWETRLYGPDVAGRRFDSGGTALGGEFRVNSITTTADSTITFPSVAVGPDGRFMAVWTWDEESDGREVRGQQYDGSGVPEGGEFRVSTVTTRVHEGPFVAAGLEGDFLVTWTSWPADYSNGDVFAQWFRRDLIFADGFESGSLSAWSSAATGGGDLSVSPSAAAKLTTNGIAALVDDTTGLYVQDDSPRDELRYRARFYFDPNGFDPGEAQGHLRTRIFILFEENPTRRLAALVVRRQGGNYSLIGRARLDDDSQADLVPVSISDDAHFVEIDWRRSSGPDANDGSFELWMDGMPAGTLASLDNHASTVDFVRMGALSVKAGASGTLYFDEFESRRASTIGP